MATHFARVFRPQDGTLGFAPREKLKKSLTIFESGRRNALAVDKV